MARVIDLDARRSALEAFLAEACGAARAELLGWSRLTGGAIQENLGLDVRFEGGRLAGRRALVLRTDAPTRVAASWDRVREFAVLRRVHRAGVRVPEPVAVEPTGTVLGRPFAVMARVFGETRGPRLVRDPAVAARGAELVAELARELARIHTVRPPDAELAFLPDPGPRPALARIALYRRWLDELDAAEPVLEWALRTLERLAPHLGTEEVVLVHADFRTGNLVIRDGRLVAVLDWEFAAWSDPLEDVAWFCARYWRFGRDAMEAGGLGPREAFLGAYEAASGRRVDPFAFLWWRTLADVRWAVIALQQEARVAAGESSLELALTGHVVPRLERDILDGLAELEALR